MLQSAMKTWKGKMKSQFYKVDCLIVDWGVYGFASLIISDYLFVHWDLYGFCVYVDNCGLTMFWRAPSVLEALNP